MNNEKIRPRENAVDVGGMFHSYIFHPLFEKQKLKEIQWTSHTAPSRKLLFILK